MVWRSKEDMTVAKWRDKQDVLMISNAHIPKMMTVQIEVATKSKNLTWSKITIIQCPA